MEALRRVFESAGYQNVRTFIASGNVIFSATETDPDSLARKIEKKLLKAFGHEITVVLRTVDELRNVVKLDPFKKYKSAGDVMRFVVLLAAEPSNKPRMPLRSVSDNMEVFAFKDRTAFILARRKKTGWFGFPNNFIEKELAALATTRNWTTVVKIVAAAED